MHPRNIHLGLTCENFNVFQYLDESGRSAAFVTLTPTGEALSGFSGTMPQEAYRLFVAACRNIALNPANLAEKKADAEAWLQRKRAALAKATKHAPTL